METVRAFAVEQKMNYAIAMTTPELAKVFRGVAALPTTFVIDREGTMTGVALGPRSWDNAAAHGLVQAMLR